MPALEKKITEAIHNNEQENPNETRSKKKGLDNSGNHESLPPVRSSNKAIPLKKTSGTSAPTTTVHLCKS